VSSTKRILTGLGAVLLVVVLGGAVFVYTKVSSFDASMDRVYDVPVPSLVRSTDPAVLARGHHLVESVAPCATSSCHGTNLGGGKVIVMGPLGSYSGPNLTESGLGAAYTDGEFVRLIRHGIKKDGRSVLFMPAGDFNWMSESDVVAVVSYLRSVPPVERANQPTHIGLIGKILDRMDKLPMDIARRIDHDHIEMAPATAPTAEFGRFLARGCYSCHGKTLSGGPIPGAPASFPVPLNITPHPTGIQGWTYEDFDRLLTAGVRKNGEKLKPFMPIDAYGKLDEVEKRALFAFLLTLPPLPFGGR
jgi:hypothetical protein